MLTSALLRARVQGQRILPTYSGRGASVRELADLVVEAYRDGAAQGQRLCDVQDVLTERLSARRDVKVARGLQRLAEGRCTFTHAGELDPPALRDALFRRAAEAGPLALEPGPLGRPVAGDLVAAYALEHGLDAHAVVDALYADLPGEQRLVTFDVPDGDWLLRRYDVALVQGLLLSAVEVRITLPDLTAARGRQFFRWVKFHQLLHSAAHTDRGLEIVLDGPASLFGPSTKYGLQLARFFPALLLQERFELKATVTWTRARHRRDLVVTHEDGLVSHYRDTGAWKTKTAEHFEARWAAAPPEGWALTEGGAPLPLGPKGVVYPDYTLRRGRRKVHLELVGFWRPEWLRNHLASADRYASADLVVAISRRLLDGERASFDDHPRVVAYADALPVRRVIEVAERLLTGSPADESAEGP